jgi:hypothetical protein
VRVFLRSILLYGSECWKITAQIKKDGSSRDVVLQKNVECHGQSALSLNGGKRIEKSHPVQLQVLQRWYSWIRYSDRFGSQHERNTFLVSAKFIVFELRFAITSFQMKGCQLKNNLKMELKDMCSASVWSGDQMEKLFIKWRSRVTSLSQLLPFLPPALLTSISSLVFRMNFIPFSPSSSTIMPLIIFKQNVQRNADANFCSSIFLSRFRME